MGFNKSLLYFLILTMVGSLFAMKIIVRAYDVAYAEDDYEVKIVRVK